MLDLLILFLFCETVNERTEIMIVKYFNSNLYQVELKVEMKKEMVKSKLPVHFESVVTNCINKKMVKSRLQPAFQENDIFILPKNC